MCTYRLTLFSILSIAVLSCGGERTEDGGGQAAPGTGGSDTGQSGSGAGTGGSTEAPPTCGNGVLDELEECDDGNEVETDGCKSDCTFTCSEDSDCDDLNICNGAETCNLSDHTCAPGPPAEDGTRCGEAMACADGVCTPVSCGDGMLQEGEECDDGDNYDEKDGCTTRCTFSCVTGDDSRDCSEECNPSSVCDDETHTCTPGDPLPDGTICNLGQGYCLDGVCVDSVCGNEEQEPNEECDLGAQNGVQGSGCSASCTLGFCGDGVIEGNEQCDDGNTDNADSCDAKCRIEIAYRLTRLEISLDPAPDFCVFSGNDKQGNAFSDLFQGSLFSNALYTMMRDMMGQPFANGDANVLVHVMDLDDPTANTADPLIHLGLSMGTLAADWLSQPDKLDFPVTINTVDVDDQNLPLTRNPAELVMEGGKTLLRSTSPELVFFRSSAGDFILHGNMTQFEVDPGRSKLTPPPETVDSATLPETLGQDAAAEAQGVICGAMLAESFATIGMPAELAVLCLVDGFVPCAAGQDPTTGECDSIMTLFERGCTNLLSPAGPPDADVDGDGVNDAYSSVVKASAKRVKIVGVADPP